MYEGFGKVADALFVMLGVSVFVAWPLAMWKLVDIALWLAAHISFYWSTA